MSRHLGNDRVLEYVYGEIEPQLLADVESHLETCARCRHELEELQSVRALLAAEATMPYEAPVEAPVTGAGWRRWFELDTTWLQGFGAAAAAALVVLSLSNFTVENGADGWKVSFSLLPSSDANAQARYAELEHRLEQRGVELVEHVNSVIDAREVEADERYDIRLNETEQVVAARLQRRVDELERQLAFYGTPDWSTTGVVGPPWNGRLDLRPATTQGRPVDSNFLPVVKSRMP